MRLRQNAPSTLRDFRTPCFDLDSLYGRGPADQPYLYVPTASTSRWAKGEAGPTVPRPDLPRGPGERALIGDPRNDENLIVSQLRVAFLLFHNRVVDQVAADYPQLGRPTSSSSCSNRCAGTTSGQ